MATIRIIKSYSASAQHKATEIAPNYDIQKTVSIKDILADTDASIYHSGVCAALHQAELYGSYELEVTDMHELLLYKEIAETLAEQGFIIKISEETDTPYIVNGVVCESLDDAISAASTGGVVKLVSDTANAGVAVESGSTFVMNLDEYELLLKGPGAGSSGTKTNGMQMLKDSTIIIRDGILKADPEIKILLQNYSNLVLDNVKLYGGPDTRYLLSNNYGNIVLKNHTEFYPDHDEVAFDVYYGMNKQGEYDSGVHVTIADNTVKVNGKVEYGKADRATDEQFAQNASLIIPEDMELNIVSEGFTWKLLGDGTKQLVKS